MKDLISRQAAIDALLGITAMRNTIPLYSAIFNIKKLPSAQTEVRTQMSSADCISRQAVRLIESDSDAYPQEWNDDYEKGFTDALNKVIALPSAQPGQHTCVNCGRTVNNGGWYADGRTRCPIEEHYALPKDGYCHLWEKRNVTDDDYPERR